MAPIRNTAHNLDTAGAMGRRRKRRLDFIIVTKMEALSEAASHMVEFLPVRVTYSLASSQPVDHDESDTWGHALAIASFGDTAVLCGNASQSM